MEYTIDGYINLSFLLDKWNKYKKEGIIELTDQCGSHYTGYWLTLNNQSYFLKDPNPRYPKEEIEKEMLNELLGEELARTIGIRTIESELAKFRPDKDRFAIISKDYRQKDETICSGAKIITDYIDYLEHSKDPLTNESAFQEFFGVKTKEEMFDLISEGKTSYYYYNSLDFIWAALEYHFRNNKNKKNIVANIMQELVRRYIFQYIIMQQDFHLGNWEISKTNNTAYLVPLYDIDMAFKSEFTNVNRNNSMRSYMKEVSNIYDDITRFYFTSSPDFKGELIRQINLLNEDVIKECVEKINKKYNIKVPFINMDMFNEHRNMIINRLGIESKVRGI